MQADLFIYPRACPIAPVPRVSPHIVANTQTCGILPLPYFPNPLSTRYDKNLASIDLGIPGIVLLGNKRWREVNQCEEMQQDIFNSCRKFRGCAKDVVKSARCTSNASAAPTRRLAAAAPMSQGEEREDRGVSACVESLDQHASTETE